MYKIPQEINLSKLIGASIQQVCFAKNNICIFFEKIGFIQIERKFGVKQNNEMFFFDAYPVNNDNGLLNFLERKVSNVFVNKDRTELSLEFEKGYSLMLISDEFYESFILNIDEKSVII